MTQADRTALAEWFRVESVGLAEVGSPMYGDLERLIADDVETGGPSWELLAAQANAPTGDAVRRCRSRGAPHAQRYVPPSHMNVCPVR